MKIRMKQIKALGPCDDGWKWYLSQNAENDLKKLLMNAVSKNYSTYAFWLISALMNKKQLVEMSLSTIKLLISNKKQIYSEYIEQGIEFAENSLSDSRVKINYDYFSIKEALKYITTKSILSNSVINLIDMSVSDRLSECMYLCYIIHCRMTENIDIIINNAVEILERENGKTRLLF